MIRGFELDEEPRGADGFFQTGSDAGKLPARVVGEGNAAVGQVTLWTEEGREEMEEDKLEAESEEE